MTKTVKFALEKLTPGALRYAEVDDEGKTIKGDANGALIGSLYLRKAAMGNEVPKQFSVTINF
jgi:hypothetical protein